MIVFMVRRLIYAIPVLVAISIIAFVLVFLSGDPVYMMLPVHATEREAAILREQFGLDKPFHIQYLTFLQDLMRGDLGRSIKFNRSVAQLITGKLPSTLLLVSVGLLFSTLIAIPLGVGCAAKPYSAIDNCCTLFAMTMVSLPTFWFGIILILVFAERLLLLPSSGHGTWRHIILPAVVCGANTLGLLIRLVRTNMGDVLSQQYVVTARGKGLSESVVLFRHALKNALIPTVTILGLRFGTMLGGSIVVETVFAWPGFGWLTMQGVYARDLPLVRGAVLLIGVVFVSINLVVDFVYTLLDPRIQYS